MSNLIFFYWDGDICNTRLKILKDSIYSTRVLNPNHKIYIYTNSIKQEVFDNKFNIQVVNWDISLFEDTPVDKNTIEKHYLNCHPRERSDLFRLILLYKFGGSYIDTDDLAITPIGETKNVICRSYDPHTCHYNKLTPEDCINGKYREIPDYEHIPMFPRNDCWLNFEPKHYIIEEILNNPKFKNNNKAIYIGDDFSWQSLTLEACKNNINKLGVDFNFNLTLLYLYEDFVAHSSYWDRCHYGGEMCDIYSSIKDLNTYPWGEYKCSKNTALEILNIILKQYPMVSHMWLHSKDMKAEWLLEELNENEKYSISTWILNHIRNIINQY